MQDKAVAACVQALRAGLPDHRDRRRGRNPADWMLDGPARATLVLPLLADDYAKMPADGRLLDDESFDKLMARCALNEFRAN